jgi:hypothetical protein
LPITPTVSEFSAELFRIISLFSKPPQISDQVISGLWAELLIINESTNPDYLVSSWHITPSDKFDFNDGENKIEVKSTSGDIRAHVFSMEQLDKNLKSKLLIASIFTTRTGLGKSVFDLASSIDKRLNNLDGSLKLYEVILQTIGANTKKVEEMYFDYALGVQSMRYFTVTDIPSIDLSAIPVEVTKVHFTSDLTNSIPYRADTNDCILFKSLKYD